MDIKCPSCRKVNSHEVSETINLQCKRCGGDLAKLATIDRIAANKIDEAIRNLMNKDADTALTNAENSWRLKHSVEAAKVVFLSFAAKKNYPLACAWHLRLCKMIESS